MDAALWPYGKCAKCTNKNYCGWSNAEIVNCMNNDYQNFSPMTNYDLLISKTPEELAESFVAIAAHKRPSTYTAEGFCLDDGEMSETDWLSWLKSPVEVDNGQSDGKV